MGVDYAAFSIENSKIAYLTNIFKIQKPLVLFCGYKNYEKGALTLLRAIPEIITQMPLTNFLFIGPPTTAYNYILREVKQNNPNVSIFNLTPDNLSGVLDPKKIGAFQLADVFCMPSRSDAYGIVYLEAWATETPVIGADFPQMRQVIEAGSDGFLVPFDDSSVLATVIVKLLKDRKLRQLLGKNGYHKIVPQQSWHHIAQQYYSYYQQTLDNC